MLLNTFSLNSSGGGCFLAACFLMKWKKKNVLGVAELLHCAPFLWLRCEAPVGGTLCPLLPHNMH